MFFSLDSTRLQIVLGYIITTFYWLLVVEKFINTEAPIIVSIGVILRHRKIKYFLKTKPWQGFKPCQGCLVL